MSHISPSQNDCDRFASLQLDLAASTGKKRSESIDSQSSAHSLASPFSRQSISEDSHGRNASSFLNSPRQKFARLLRDNSPTDSSPESFRSRTLTIDTSTSELLEPHSIFTSHSSELEKLGITLISEEKSPTTTLKQKGYVVEDNLLGRGSFGEVYSVSSTSQSDANLVFKSQFDKSIKIIDYENQTNEKFWRHGDFAPTRLDLPHLAKATSFVVTVKSANNRDEQLFIPAESIKDFGNILQQIDPTAKVVINSQLIERAPGQSLASLASDPESGLSDPSSKHFNNILTALHAFLKESYKANFVHGDLKPENIMYDLNSGVMTIIDTGASSRLRSREKSSSLPKGKSNPATSSKTRGSQFFMSPVVLAGSDYSSEVDFFSAGMVLLNLISEKDFKVFVKDRDNAIKNFDDILSDENFDDILSSYLSRLPANSETQKTLEQYPALKKIITLDFQASNATNEEKAQASKEAVHQLEGIFS